MVSVTLLVRLDQTLLFPPNHYYLAMSSSDPSGCVESESCSFGVSINVPLFFSEPEGHHSLLSTLRMRQPGALLPDIWTEDYDMSWVRQGAESLP